MEAISRLPFAKSGVAKLRNETMERDGLIPRVIAITLQAARKHDGQSKQDELTLFC